MRNKWVSLYKQDQYLLQHFVRVNLDDCKGFPNSKSSVWELSFMKTETANEWEWHEIRECFQKFIYINFKSFIATCFISDSISHSVSNSFQLCILIPWLSSTKIRNCFHYFHCLQDSSSSLIRTLIIIFVVTSHKQVCCVHSLEWVNTE